MKKFECALPSPRKSFYSVFVKRFLDLVLSGIAIVLLLPVFLVIMILEVFIHGFPIFFCQERVGYNEKPFKLLKFRSMNNAKDENGTLLPGNLRITKFGKFLRRFSLDELPELFCIFVGKMSFIGPRPLLVSSLPHYSKRHRTRHLIRPGLALVSLKKIKTWTWNDQFENDVWYLQNVGFFLDIRMFFAVIKEALKGSDYRVEDTRSEFDGTNLYE